MLNIIILNIKYVFLYLLINKNFFNMKYTIINDTKIKEINKIKDKIGLLNKLILVKVKELKLKK